MNPNEQRDPGDETDAENQPIEMQLRTAFGLDPVPIDPESAIQFPEFTS